MHKYKCQKCGKIINITVIRRRERWAICTDCYPGEYKGALKDGKKHGRGIYIYKDCAEYNGEWKDDKYHGRGTITFRDGTKYIGEFKDNIAYGKGKFEYYSGKNFYGKWINGTWQNINDENLVVSYQIEPQVVKPRRYLSAEAGRIAVERTKKKK